MTTETATLRGPLRKRESNLWSRDPDDWYAEPEWCSRRLFATEKFQGAVWDPAAGFGTIVKSAIAAGLSAFGTDLIDRGYGPGGIDFLKTEYTTPRNIVSNPPFALAQPFVVRALHLASAKVAMLLPAIWVQGDERSRWLETTPLQKVLFLTPRPSMPPGPILAAGAKPGNGTKDFAWFIWSRGHRYAPTIGWLRRDD